MDKQEDLKKRILEEYDKQVVYPRFGEGSVRKELLDGLENDSLVWTSDLDGSIGNGTEIKEEL